MGKLKRFTQEEIDIMVKLYDNGNGLNYTEIAREIGRPRVSISRKLKSLDNVETKVVKSEFTQKEIDEMVKLYTINKMNFSEIGQKMNKNSTSVWHKIKSLNIKDNRTMLWDIEYLRPHIVDIKKAKELTIGSEKPITVHCKLCNVTKQILVYNFVNRGMSCNCTKGIPYPELYVMSYFETKGFEYKYQVKFDDSLRRIDFYIPSLDVYIETHGLAHYKELKGSSWKNAHKNTVKSDKIKRKWCEDNNKKLIELDCRESTFNFIRNSVDESILPSINDNEVKRMLELIELNKNYDIPLIKQMYLDENKTTRQIGDVLNITYATVNNILERIGVKLRDSGKPKRKIKCVENGAIYPSIAEAKRQTKITNISKCLKGDRKTAGGYHWEYVDNE